MSFPGPGTAIRLQAEAAAVARLDHPNLVRIYEVGEWDGRPFFSMEYVDGSRLAEILQGTPMSPQRAAELARALARASESAHERGVVHRDLTPTNVLITSDGQPKIVDFGLSKLITGGAGATMTGDVLGTASYMAPEQAGGRSKEVGPSADVYALGAILYEMLTGRPPFKAETPLDTLSQVVHDDPVAPARLQPKVPRNLENICLKCLNKEPARRYPSALALAEDLDRYLAGEPVRARPVGTVSRAARWARRRPAVAALLALCGAGALIAFGLVTWEGRRASRAQASAVRAGQEEKRQRIAAEEAHGREAEQRRLYQELSARLLRDRGLRHCEDGDVGLGLLWLAQSLRLVPADDLDLQRAIRTNLAGWRGQTHTLQGLLGHADRVLSAVWSPDGKLILTACADRTARLWDAATGALQRPRDGPPPSRFACRLQPGRCHDLDRCRARGPALDDGDGRTRRGTPPRPGKWGRAHLPPVQPGRRSPLDGRPAGPVGLASVLADEQRRTGRRPFRAGPRNRAGDVQPRRSGAGHGRRLPEVPPRLWRTGPPAPIRALMEHTRRVSSVAFNPRNGLTFVTGSLDRTCFVWDSSTGEPVRGPLRLPGQIGAVAFSPNGRTIVAGASDGTAQFWDVERAIPLHALMRHPDAVSAAQFSPDGRWASTLSWDRVYLWDAATGEPLGAPIPHPKEVVSVTFEPDSRLILTRGRDFTVRIWETTAARPAGARLVHNGWVTAVAFRPPRGDSFLTAVGGQRRPGPLVEDGTDRRTLG